MNKKTIIIIIVIILLSVFSYSVFKNKQDHEMFSNNGIYYSSKINDNRFQVLNNEEWKDILIKGVNMGMTRPGKWDRKSVV